MKRAVTTLALLLGAVSALAASDFKAVPFESYVPHPYFSIYDGPNRPTFAALNSEHEWQRLWSLIEPRMSREESRRTPHELPNVDFSHKTLIVVAIGSRPNGGFQIRLESISESPSEIVVTATESTPGANCVVTTSVTAPTGFALIPRTNKRVRFDVRKKAVNCSQ